MEPGANSKMPNAKLPQLLLLIILIWIIFINCDHSNSQEQPIQKTPAQIEKTIAGLDEPDSHIPILCYHQVRDWKSNDSKNARTYILPVDAFKEQMKWLHDRGYHTILPDQLIAYIEKGTALPPHPVMLTFDDAIQSQYINALPELNKAGFKAVFFIMTVVLNHNEYMSKDEVEELAKQGHVIGCHTWDHRPVTLYNESDWMTELEKPTAELEKITGKPIKYFAYPYGTWDDAAISRLEKNGYTAAFQLWGKGDQPSPLYTIKRQLVSGYWDTKEFINTIHRLEKTTMPKI